MKRHEITLIEGEGIGPEVAAAMKRAVDATGVSIDWRVISELGTETGELNPEAVTAIEETKVAIKGPTGTPLGEGHRSFNVQLRERFDLFANVRPVKAVPGLTTRWSDVPVDLILFRENLEDLYVGEECEIDGGAEAISRITESVTRRHALFARRYMKVRDRKNVTVGAKTNILKLSHGLFERVSREVLEDEGITYTHLLPDALGSKLVAHPDWFDCVVLPNSLGDVFSDIASEFVGGLGVAPGANIGSEYAVFEAVHGTAPDIAGKGIANPTALMLSAVMMLEYINEVAAAEKLRSAIEAVYKEGSCLTGDVSKDAPVSTDVFADAVIGNLEM